MTRIAKIVKRASTAANPEHRSIKEAVRLEHNIEGRFHDAFKYQCREA